MSIDYDSKISDVVKAVPPSAIRKFFDLASEMKGVISLSIGEPDFVAPWSIRQAGIDSLIDGYTHYSPNSGYTLSKKAITSYIKKRYDVEYSYSDEILITVGGSEAIDLITRSLINPGDEAIIVEPCFVAYKAAISLAHGVPVVVETKEENDFKLIPSDLESKITDKTKMIIIGFPSNPTGAVMTMDELEGIKEVLLRHPDIIVVSDELYCELNYFSDEPASLIKFPELKSRVVMVNGFSKSYAMTGFRIGYAVGPKELIAPMTKIHQYAIMSAPSMSQFALVKAALDCSSDVELMRTEYNHRRRVVMAGLKEAGLSCFEPFGAFYAFPSIKSLNMSSEEFCERFLMEKKVAIVPGNAFGECGEGYVRISYAASMESIKIAMERIIEFCDEIRKGKSS